MPAVAVTYAALLLIAVGGLFAIAVRALYLASDETKMRSNAATMFGRDRVQLR